MDYVKDMIMVFVNFIICRDVKTIQWKMDFIVIEEKYAHYAKNYEVNGMNMNNSDNINYVSFNSLKEILKEKNNNDNIRKKKKKMEKEKYE